MIRVTFGSEVVIGRGREHGRPTDHLVTHFEVLRVESFETVETATAAMDAWNTRPRATTVGAVNRTSRREASDE